MMPEEAGTDEGPEAVEPEAAPVAEADDDDEEETRALLIKDRTKER